jgi:hypothetical protein
MICPADLAADQPNRQNVPAVEVLAAPLVLIEPSPAVNSLCPPKWSFMLRQDDQVS